MVGGTITQPGTTARRISTNATRSTVEAIITDGTSAAETHTVTDEDLAPHGAFFLNDLPGTATELYAKARAHAAAADMSLSGLVRASLKARIAESARPPCKEETPSSLVPGSTS